MHFQAVVVANDKERITKILSVLEIKIPPRDIQGADHRVCTSSAANFASKLSPFADIPAPVVPPVVAFVQCSAVYGV